jgi:VanZ family protein
MRQYAKYGSPLFVLLGLALFPENLTKYWLPVGFDIFSISILYLMCRPLREKDGASELLLFWLAPIALMWLLSERREGRDINSVSIAAEVFLGGGGTALLLAKNILHKHDIKIILAILATWIVAYLSGSSGGADRMVPWFSFVGLSIDQLNTLIVVIRKTIHVSFYGSLSWFIATYLWNEIPARKQVMAFALAFPLVVAIADEYRQSFMTNRSGCVSDVVLDMSAASAVVIALVLWDRHKRLQNGKSV